MTKKSNNCNLLTLPSGKLRYKLTNDYMFRAVFQENENALKGLLSALLRKLAGTFHYLSRTFL